MTGASSPAANARPSAARAAEHVEHVRGHEQRVGDLGAAVGLQLRRRHEGEVALEAVERGVHLLEVEEVGRRQRIARQVLLGVEAPDVHEPRVIAIGQRLQQHAVDDGEDRGGGADAERQREHGERAEHRRLDCESNGMARSERRVSQNMKWLPDDS